MIHYIMKSTRQNYITNIAGLAVFFVVVMGLFSKPVKAARKVHRVALLFSHNYSGGRAKTLRYAVSDAKKFRSVLFQVAGHQPHHTYLVANRNADAVRRAFQKVKQAIASLKKQHGPHAKIMLVVYYSGHARDGKFFLGSTDLSFRELREFLKTSGASLRMAFLDTCGSGRFLQTRGLARRKRNFRIPMLNSHTAEGEAVITSTGDRENAYEDLKLRGGIFTHYMVTGLRGAADRDKDGHVTLNELYAFTYNWTLNRTVFARSGPQKPHFQTNLKGAGQVVLSSTQRSTTKLVLHRSLKGQFFLWKGDKMLYAGFYKAPGQKMRLAVAPGTYKIQWRQNNHVYTSRVSLRSKHVTYLGLRSKRLAFSQRSLASRGVATTIDEPPVSTWKVLPNRTPPSVWSVFVQGSASNAAFVQGTLFGGAAVGIRHRYGALRLGLRGTSVPRVETDVPQLNLSLRAEVGYPIAYKQFYLFLGGYAGAGLLFQNIGVSPQTGLLLHAGGLITPGFWLNQHWAIALPVNVGITAGAFGFEFLAYPDIGGALELRYRF